MVWALGLLVSAVAVTLVAPALRRPECWSIRHPAAALGLWLTAFVTGCVTFLGADLAVVVVAITLHQGGGAWLTATAIVVAAWSALGAVGAALAVVSTRMEHSLQVAHATRAEVLLLTACATYRTGVVGGVEVSYVHSDRPFALSLRDDGPRIVVSEALDEALDADQLRAVLEHERAHLRGRHDLVVAIAGLAQTSTPMATRRPRVPPFRGAVDRAGSR